MWQVYLRCPRGDYFAGPSCPFDGWSSQASHQLSRVVDALAPSDNLPLILTPQVGSAGLSMDARGGWIVVELADPVPSPVAWSVERVYFHDYYRTNDDVDLPHRSAEAVASSREVVTRAYCLCSSWHYSMGIYCGEDGTTSRSQRELGLAADRVLEGNEGRPKPKHARVLSMQLLADLGVSTGALRRSMVVHFASRASVFSVLQPGQILIGGQLQPWPPGVYRSLIPMAVP